MVSNPDQSRRKDSLRQFVVTLFERKQLRQLAAYPYIDMFDDLEMIIESRARSVDLKVNNYYDFLYSFHVTKENYRKAAHVMYECGMRLGNELCTLEGLKRQAKAYLASINCLKLVDAKNAWIVRPVLKAKNVAGHSKAAIGVSPKRSHEGDEIEPQVTERKMEVLELHDIERDFQIVCARLKLAIKHAAPPSFGGSGLQVGAAALVGGGQGPPGETVALLVAANLYEDAVKIATAFRPRLDCRPIVEGLAAKCVLLARTSAGEHFLFSLGFQLYMSVVTSSIILHNKTKGHYFTQFCA